MNDETTSQGHPPPGPPANSGGNAEPQGASQGAPPGGAEWVEVLATVGELAAGVAGLRAAAKEPLSDVLAQLLLGQYALAARIAVQATAGRPLDLAALRAISQGVVALRRGDLYAARVQVEQERLALEREASQFNFERRCEEWARKPENQKKFCPNFLTDAEQIERIRRIFAVDRTDEDPREEEPGGAEQPHA